jgi:hypothetical protein
MPPTHGGHAEHSFDLATPQPTIVQRVLQENTIFTV